MGELVFNQNRANLIVHCMVSEKPASWDSNWDFTYNEQYKITVEWNVYHGLILYKNHG